MQCKVSKIVSQNDENGWVCLDLIPAVPKEVAPKNRNRFYKDGKVHFTGTGYNIPAHVGLELEIEGSWGDSKYGRQLNISRFMEIRPVTEEGIIAYLGSGLIKGVGPSTARAIVAEFGTDTFTVLDNEPHRLLEIKGITRNKLERVLISYKDSQNLKEIVSVLTPFGISVKKARKIQDEYGLNALQVVEKDTYRMCEIKGFAFLTVDEIARKMGTPMNDPKRICGCINYILDITSSSGNVFLDKDTLAKECRKLLNEKTDLVVADGEITLQINNLVKSKQLIHEYGPKSMKELNSFDPGDKEKRISGLYLPALYKEEVRTAQAIVDKLLLFIPQLDYSEIIRAVQKEFGIFLTAMQITAINMALNSPLSVLTGGPGTGKTTTLRVLLEVYKRTKNGAKMLAAPTGLASRKMSESTGMDAGTLHKALGLIADDGNFVLTGKSKLEADYIVIDESSMLDSHVACELFTRLKPETQILIVGDSEQLPAVGPGKILRDLIESEVVPVTVLDVIHRQAQDSLINVNANRIRDGIVHLVEGTDFTFIPAEDSEAAATIIFEQYLKEITANGLDSTQVLSPRRDVDEASAQKLNAMLQSTINPKESGKAQIVTGNKTYRLGDKVINTKNKKDLFNGDIGYVTDITKNEEGEQLLQAEFSGNRMGQYEKDDLDMLDLAYSVTIHKSQGSEYQTVIIPVLFSFFIMLRRDLIYTAVTRAKTKVILVGQKKALYKAISTPPAERNTRLAVRINQLFLYHLHSRQCNTKSMTAVPQGLCGFFYLRR